MLQDNIKILISIIILVLIQTLIFNQITLFGFSYPTVYLFFVISYRFDKSQFILIFLGFLLGLTIDLLQGSSGANTIATLFISFLRPLIIKFSFGNNLDSISLLNMNSKTSNQVVYTASIIIVHQVIMQCVAYLDFDHFMVIFRNTIVNSTLTFIILFSSVTLFKSKN
jgi:rod shape-determining protein MreD